MSRSLVPPLVLPDALEDADSGGHDESEVRCGRLPRRCGADGCLDSIGSRDEVRVVGEAVLEAAFQEFLYGLEELDVALGEGLGCFRAMILRHAGC